MNPYRDTVLNSLSLPTYSPPDSHNSHDSSAMSPSPPATQRGQRSVSELRCDTPPHVHPSEQDGGPSVVSDFSDSPLPASDPVFSLKSRLESSLAEESNPYPALDTPPSCQVSVIIPSPDLHPSYYVDDSSPDLECSICFSQFNNVFQCPKMLQCKHTFCLECLARINIKSAQPNTIQCPLCRSLTPLPDLGLPKLTTDSNVLSYLPAAMQRVYSIRFLRNKGKLQVKRSCDSQRRWGPRSINPSLDLGLPSPPAGGQSSSQSGGVGEALFRLTGRPACRAFLLTSVVLMMALLTGIIVFLLTFKDPNRMSH